MLKCKKKFPIKVSVPLVYTTEYKIVCEVDVVSVRFILLIFVNPRRVSVFGTIKPNLYVNKISSLRDFLLLSF